MDDSLFLTRDLRSPSHPKTRHLKSTQKYLSHRSHHPSIIGQPYIAFREDLKPRPKPHPQLHQSNRVITPESTCIRTWTKRDQWSERLVDIWPIRPPHHYGRCRGCHTGPPGGFESNKQRRKAFRQDLDVEDLDAVDRDIMDDQPYLQFGPWDSSPASPSLPSTLAREAETSAGHHQTPPLVKRKPTGLEDRNTTLQTNNDEDPSASKLPDHQPSHPDNDHAHDDDDGDNFLETYTIVPHPRTSSIFPIQHNDFDDDNDHNENDNKNNDDGNTDGDGWIHV